MAEDPLSPLGSVSTVFQMNDETEGPGLPTTSPYVNPSPVLNDNGQDLSKTTTAFFNDIHTNTIKKVPYNMGFDYGYFVMGHTASPTPVINNVDSGIRRFPFASATTISQIGSHVISTGNSQVPPNPGRNAIISSNQGMSSEGIGYYCEPSPSPSNTYGANPFPFAAGFRMYKFPFASGAVVQKLISSPFETGAFGNAGHTNCLVSPEHGYFMGAGPPTFTSTTAYVRRFSFNNSASFGTTFTQLIDTTGLGPAGRGVFMKGTASDHHHGYVYGGVGPTTAFKTNIQRFNFNAMQTGALEDVGELVEYKSNAGSSGSSFTHGYNFGGTESTTSPFSSTVNSNSTDQIIRFPFAAGWFGKAEDVGEMTQALSHSTISSSTDGSYISGGQTQSTSSAFAVFPIVDTVNKYLFASTTGTAIDVGELSSGVKTHGAGLQS